MSNSNVLQKQATYEELKQLLKVEQLPAMPHSALVVLQLDNDLTKVNINDLVRPIEADPGLATQVLKFLNSAFFGFQHPVSNIKQGIALAGIRMVKNFVLWKAVFSLLPRVSDQFFDVKHLWQDSLRRALYAKMLCQKFRGDSDLTFIGALLQDIAIPLLLKKVPNKYTDILQGLNEKPYRRLSEIEREKQAWDHGEAGYVMCSNWGIPDDLSQLIGNHTKIDEYVGNPLRNPEQLCVSISALLPSVVCKKWMEKEMLLNNMTSLFPTEPDLTYEMFEQVDREFNQYATVLQISNPIKTLAEMY